MTQMIENMAAVAAFLESKINKEARYWGWLSFTDNLFQTS